MDLPPSRVIDMVLVARQAKEFKRLAEIANARATVIETRRAYYAALERLRATLGGGRHD